MRYHYTDRPDSCWTDDRQSRSTKEKKKKKQVKKPTAKTKMERVHEEDDAGEEESPDWQLLARFIKFVTRLPPYSTEV